MFTVFSTALVLATQTAGPAAPLATVAPFNSSSDPPQPQAGFARADGTRSSRKDEPTSPRVAPGGWRTLTLIGTARSGVRFWLLATERSGGPGWTGLAVPGGRTALTEVGLAIAIEFRAHWPRLFFGVIVASAAPGQPRAQRLGLTAATGLIWTIPRLFGRAHR